jgi:hypothetical protein
MLSPYWLLILIVLVVLVLATLLLLYLLLKRARKVAYSPEPKAQAEEKKEAASTGFMQQASDLELRSSFKRAIKLLRTYVTGKDYRYQVPWYLMAGEANSGKSTVLESTGLDLAVDKSLQPDSRRLDWYFFNEGIVIDVSGDFVLRADGTSDQRGWNTISNLLQKHRPQRPLDGIVLTIPCTDLLRPGGLDHVQAHVIEQKATTLYKKLWQSQKILGMSLPVYVLVTKCDQVAGFTSFCREIPARLQSQMFGWSNPRTLETAYRPDSVSQAFQSIHQYLTQMQFEIYAERDETIPLTAPWTDIQAADDLFLFPSEMQSLRAPLQVYLDVLFKQSAFHESFFFRGLYFCGDNGVPPPIEALSPLREEAAVEWANEPIEFLPVTRPTDLPRELQTQNDRPVFLADLFEKKIFDEPFLARPIPKTLLSRNRTVIVCQVLSLLILLVGGGGLLLSYNGLKRQETELYEFLVEERDDLKSQLQDSYREGGTRPTISNISYQAGLLDTAAPEDDPTSVEHQTLHNSEAKLLAGMARMNGKWFYSVFMPGSWFSSINQSLKLSIAAAFKYVILESLRSDLEDRSRQLLNVEAGRGPLLGSVPEAKQSYLRVSANSVVYDHVRPDPNFALRTYVEELGMLRINIERYERLSKKDSASITDLRNLVDYLNHARVPESFDQENELYQQALKIAEGRPLDARQIYRDAALKVAEIIEELYDTSFDRANVNYDYLNDIGATEALLRRPEYTWLASSIFGPRSPFQGMTTSAALRELKQALQDLQREGFMSKNASFESTRAQRRVRRVLVWDQDTLRQSIAVYNDYQAFLANKSYEPSENLDNSVKQAATARVRSKIGTLIIQAQKYRPIAQLTEGSTFSESLIEETRGLQTAQDLLSQVLEVSGKLGIDQELRNALAAQTSYLLRGIQREFIAQRFYAMKAAPDFAWWDGSQPVSYVAYDLSGTDDVAAYLTIQRKNITLLARDLASPVMTFAASQNISSQTSQVNWSEILADLDAYDNKAPGNPIGALENFIRTDMDRVSVEACSQNVRPGERSADFFLRIRNSLRVQLYRRCTQLAHVKAVNDNLEALVNYREIEESFNRRLAGGFPFFEIGGQGAVPEVDPSALLEFFKLLDRKEKGAREALNRSSVFGASPQAALDFLDQLDNVHAFFAPLLEKKQGPVFDFRVQFRVDREEEIGANQIIDWKLEVGKKTFTYLSDDLTGHWVWGDPIRLTLRWANDSPRVPVSTALPARVRAANRVAVFEYNDRWALFTLLIKHGFLLRRAGTSADCDQGFDPDPYTLKFSVRTEPDPVIHPVQPEILKALTAEVFLRLSLAAANKQEPLMLPCFPVRAPSMPFVIVKPKAEDQ